MSETYQPGELFVYVNGDRWELGQVKRPNNTGDGYFCWYSTGDTAANTPTECMHKLANARWSHVDGKMYAVKTWSELDDWGVSYIEHKLYRTREEAERRAEEVRGESCDELWYDAMVVEFEVAE